MHPKQQILKLLISHQSTIKHELTPKNIPSTSASIIKTLIEIIIL